MVSEDSETLLEVLRTEASQKSQRDLLAVSALAASAALLAAILGATSWILPAIAYVIWCFSAWGILFARRSRAGRSGHVMEQLLVATGFGVAIAILIALFFLALGPPWVL